MYASRTSRGSIVVWAMLLTNSVFFSCIFFSTDVGDPFGEYQKPSDLMASDPVVSRSGAVSILSRMIEMSFCDGVGVILVPMQRSS